MRKLQPHRIKDVTGQRFGKLLVLGLVDQHPKTGAARFRCKCDCGKEIIVYGSHLTKPKPQQSCGCKHPATIDPNRSHKTCARCRIDKFIEAFLLSKHAPDGHGIYCRECMRVVRKKYNSTPRSKQMANERIKRRRKVDPAYRIEQSIRGRVLDVLKGRKKHRPTLVLLGCTREKLVEHLERQFRPGMSWDNYGKGPGKWNVDHIRPCASFDLTDPEQQKVCFHYVNLQPLWYEDNLKKSDNPPIEGLSLLGGSGFIGSHYAKAFPDVHVEPRNTNGPSRKDVLYFISTTSNYNVFTDTKIDINTNLSKLVQVLPHVDGIFNYVSTWFVYGKSGVGLTPESAAKEIDPCDPTGFYSITKLTAERYVRSYVDSVTTDKVLGPKGYRILRLCGVIGNDPRASAQKNALEMMLQRVVRGEDVDIYTGDNYRNILHVSDVCRAIHLCLSRDETLNTITNIGAPGSVRIYDLIMHAKSVTGSKSRVNLIAPPRFHQIVQVPDFHMDTTKLRALGFTPTMTAYEAVERVLGGMV